MLEVVVEVLGVQLVTVVAKEMCRWETVDMAMRQRQPAFIREYLSALQVRIKLIAIRVMGMMIGTVFTGTSMGTGVPRGARRNSSGCDCGYYGYVVT